MYVKDHQIVETFLGHSLVQTIEWAMTVEVFWHRLAGTQSRRGGQEQNMKLLLLMTELRHA